MTEQYNPLTNPFPGLRPFESNEEHLFFGRDGQSDELLRRLRRKRFLAVLGTSGSGKSSLVRAGLLPSLYGGLMTQAGSGWRVALFRPGQNPIGHLAEALTAPNVFGGDEEDDAVQKTITEANLRRSALGLVEAVRQSKMPVNENLLVVVDQFEEIFRFRRTARRDGTEDEAAAFIKLLLEAKNQTAVPIYIVITMRSDFLGDCSQFRDLPEAINEGQYLIPRMTRDQRREAITGPVAVGGGQISPRLVNRLLNDVGDDPDHLPILQHALMRTWDFWVHHARDGEHIDLTDYEAVGAMAHALSRHADEAYNELPSERSRTIAEKLFKSLTEKGPDNREIRRPTRVHGISGVAEASPEEVIAVIERFRLPGRSFLMPPANVKLRPDSLIDISHESLIRGWERLKNWVDEEARSAQIYRRLAETATLHKEGRAGLWHDPDLALALHWRNENRPNAIWAQRYHPDFEQAMAFLSASKAAREAEIAEKERHRRREIRRTQVFATILGIAFLTSLGLAVLANSARTRAEAQTRIAESATREAKEQRRIAEAKAEEARAQTKIAEAATTEAKKQTTIAEAAKDSAQRQARIAEQRRQEAQAASERARQAQALAEQQRKRAEASALESAQSAMRVRKQNLNDMSSINSLVDRLIELSSPEEGTYWRSYKATALTELGRHDLSRDESSKMLDTFGDNLNALTNRGYMSLILHQPEDALRDFERARDLDPHNALGYLNVGVTRASLKDYAGATDSIRSAIEWYRPLYLDGVFESEVSDDIKQATHRTVITADGNAFNAALYYEIANLAAFQGSNDFDNALAEADRHAEKTSPSVEGYLTALNWAWLQLRGRPEDYGALAMQAHLWQKAGYDAWARYYYLKFQCTQQKQNDPRYHNLALWVDRQLKQLPSNLASADCSTPPDGKLDEPSRMFEAGELATIGKYDEAITLLNTAIQNDPENIELLLSRARYRKWRGEWERENSEARNNYWSGSRQDFTQALKLAEKDTSYKPYVYLMWASFGHSLGAIDDRERQEYLRRALELGPAASFALTDLADLIATTNKREAINLVKRSLILDPSADNYYKLAKLQDDSGLYQDASASINMAISLRDDNSEFYKERERAEAGLGVSELERKRHLAAGYMETGDTMLRRLKTDEAYAAYKDSLTMLSDLAKVKTDEAVSSDLATVNSRLSHLKEIASTERLPELISGRVVHITGGEGLTRVVTIDRGSEDGLTAGGEGRAWSVYSNTGNHERKVQVLGRARVLNVGPRSATAEVIMDDATGDKLVRVGDMVEIKAKIPPLPVRSVLWRLAKYHIRFTSEDGERVFNDYRKLYAEEKPELDDELVNAMLDDIHKTVEALADREVMNKKLVQGRFKDQTLRQVMEHPTRADLLDFLNYVMKYPATFYGKDEKLGRAWGTWVLQGAPK